MSGRVQLRGLASAPPCTLPTTRKSRPVIGSSVKKGSTILSDRDAPTETEKGSDPFLDCARSAAYFAGFVYEEAAFGVDQFEQLPLVD